MSSETGLGQRKKTQQDQRLNESVRSDVLGPVYLTGFSYFLELWRPKVLNAYSVFFGPMMERWCIQGFSFVEPYTSQ